MKDEYWRRKVPCATWRVSGRVVSPCRRPFGAEIFAEAATGIDPSKDAGETALLRHDRRSDMPVGHSQDDVVDRLIESDDIDIPDANIPDPYPVALSLAFAHGHQVQIGENADDLMIIASHRQMMYVMLSHQTSGLGQRRIEGDSIRKRRHGGLEAGVRMKHKSEALRNRISIGRSDLPKALIPEQPSLSQTEEPAFDSSQGSSNGIVIKRPT